MTVQDLIKILENYKSSKLGNGTHLVYFDGTWDNELMVRMGDAVAMITILPSMEEDEV